MTTQSQNKMEYASLLLTVILFIAAIVMWIITGNNPNTFGLGKLVISYLIIIVGSIVAFILSFKSRKNLPVFVLSIVSSLVFLSVLSVLTFFLAVANGISEP